MPGAVVSLQRQGWLVSRKWMHRNSGQRRDLGSLLGPTHRRCTLFGSDATTLVCCSECSKWAISELPWRNHEQLPTGTDRPCHTPRWMGLCVQQCVLES